MKQKYQQTYKNLFNWKCEWWKPGKWLPGEVGKNLEYSVTVCLCFRKKRKRKGEKKDSRIGCLNNFSLCSSSSQLLLPF